MYCTFIRVGLNIMKNKKLQENIIPNVFNFWLTFFFLPKKQKKPIVNISKKKKFSTTEDVRNACMELATPILELTISIKIADCKYIVNFFEIILLVLRCKRFKAKRKFIKPSTSIKSQPHQPFQFSSCWAHQLPRIRAYNDTVAHFCKRTFWRFSYI